MIRRRLAACLGAGTVVAAAITGCSNAGSAGHRVTAVTEASSPSISPGKVDVAHLQVSIATTSDWTELRLSGGTILAQHLSHAHGRGFTVEPFGVAMHGAHGRSRVVDDLVFSDTSGRKRFRLTLQKGYDGKTAVALQNLNGPRPTSTRSYADSVHSTSDSSNSKEFSLSRATVMGSHVLALPRADPRHLVLADFYPWWSTYDDPKLADTPSDPRSTTTLSGLESLTAQAKANGVNGFVVSWDGQSGHGQEFDLAVKAAQHDGQVVTGYLESLEAQQHKNPARTELLWLHQLLTHASSRAFLRSGGEPVVFVYQMSALTPPQWAGIVRSLSAKYAERVRLVGDATAPAYLPFEWGLDSYAATTSPADLRDFAIQTSAEAKAAAVVGEAAKPGAFIGTVSPGFDDQKLRGNTHPVVPRAGGKRYAATWRAALAGQPDWILVTSWNEWFEDTQIEPGRHSGAKSLAQTKSFAAHFSG